MLSLIIQYKKVADRVMTLNLPWCQFVYNHLLGHIDGCTIVLLFGNNQKYDQINFAFKALLSLIKKVRDKRSDDCLLSLLHYTTNTNFINSLIERVRHSGSRRIN